MIKPRLWPRIEFFFSGGQESRRRDSTTVFHYHAIVLISLASKVMLNILLAKFQQYMNWELLDMQTGLSNQRSNCQHSLDHRESKGVPEKNISICFTDYAKAFHCVNHNKLWKILKEMGVPGHLTFLLTSLYVG